MLINNSLNKSYNQNFLQNRYAYCRDGFGYRRIKSVFFDYPIRLDKAISEISSDKTLVAMLGYYKYFAKKILSQIQNDLSFNKELQKIKVKGMINYGQTAFVFETEEGNILKITSRDHFLGRKAEKFDLSIKSRDKLTPKSYCYYYIEEKTSDLVNDKEMDQTIREIKELGFDIVDCGIRQFGKTKNGQIVLIDPECVRKRGLAGMLKQKSAKIKAYIHLFLAKSGKIQNKL